MYCVVKIHGEDSNGLDVSFIVYSKRACFRLSEILMTISIISHAFLKLMSLGETARLVIDDDMMTCLVILGHFSLTSCKENKFLTLLCVWFTTCRISWILFLSSLILSWLINPLAPSLQMLMRLECEMKKTCSCLSICHSGCLSVCHGISFHPISPFA